MAFQPNYSTPLGIELHLTSDTPTNVTVQYPANSPTFNTTVAVNPGSITIVVLPTAASQSWTPDSIQNNCVRAFAPVEFVAYMINRLTATSDAALALPVDTGNTEYLVMDYNPAFIGAQFTVVGLYDNTTVQITPKQGIVGHPAGVTFNEILNRGQAFFARGATLNATNTLTGSVITADKPIALTNGNGCTQIPTGTTACDHIFEVAQPVQSWGNKILVANLPNRPAGSIYRILASQDGTSVTKDGAALATLNRGQFFETPVTAGNHEFAADKPIFVVQYMTGQDYPGQVRIGDPAMANMIPAAQYQKAYTFSTVGANQFAENYVSIIAQNADVSAGTILLDGAAIPAADFAAIGATGYSATVKRLTSGTHTTSSAGFHGITVEGYGSYDSYSYPGGAAFEFINPVGDSNPPICASLFHAGPPPFVTGTATDNRPTEDTNGNGLLDVGEDLNGNGIIDKDTGIFFVELQPGATNLTLTTPPFVPGTPAVNFSVALTDPTKAGAGTVKATDGAGNVCTVPVDLKVIVPVCDIDKDGDIDKNDLALISKARGQQAVANDPRDADRDGLITPNDVKVCIPKCTRASCAVQ